MPAHRAHLDTQQVDGRPFIQARTTGEDHAHAQGSPSSGASAARWSRTAWKPGPPPPAVRRPRRAPSANARPPASTDATDCVLTVRPLAFSATSTPLAFQKRDCCVTSDSFGASMKTCTSSALAPARTHSRPPGRRGCGGGRPASRHRANRGRRRAARKLRPGSPRKDQRRRVEADELALGLLGAAGIDADIGARHQRGQSADAAGADARGARPRSGCRDGDVLDALVQRHVTRTLLRSGRIVTRFTRPTTTS